MSGKHRLPGLLGTHSACQDCWGSTVCAEVTAVAQHVLEALGSCSVCLDCWGHSVCVRALGLSSVCCGCWDRAACAAITKVMQHELEGNQCEMHTKKCAKVGK